MSKIYKLNKAKQAVRALPVLAVNSEQRGDIAFLTQELALYKDWYFDEVDTSKAHISRCSVLLKENADLKLWNESLQAQRDESTSLYIESESMLNLCTGITWAFGSALVLSMVLNAAQYAA